MHVSKVEFRHPHAVIEDLDVLPLTMKISILRKQQLLWKIIFMLMICSNWLIRSSM